MSRFLDHIKKNWFPYILAGIAYGIFSIMGNLGSEINAKRCSVETDRPSCYLFYGIAQNKLNGPGLLKVNFLIENFPKRPHQVFVEIINPKGQLDFLYSTSHAASHRAHLCKGRCQRQYKAIYKIPKLDLGTYKLRVTFKFKYLLGTKDLVSNDIKFEVK